MDSSGASIPKEGSRQVRLPYVRGDAGRNRSSSMPAAGCFVGGEGDVVLGDDACCWMV